MFRTWSEWSLNQWLSNLESRHVQERQLGLTRISDVARKLNVIPDCNVITVAGTNGKGSTVSALETIYHTAGYKVGSYTSPHLIHFNERIRTNLIPISDSDLCHAFSIIEDARGHIQLTYFEMATLAALWHFRQQQLDILILEVGLGGRLDATNIVDADLSIITTIDYDHQDFLGTTLEAIGYEKAGILRQGKPFIYADNNAPQSIVKRAKELEAPSYFYGKEFSFEEREDSWDLEYLNNVMDSSAVRTNHHTKATSLDAYVPRLVRGIQEPGSLDPADKPRDVGEHLGVGERLGLEESLRAEESLDVDGSLRVVAGLPRPTIQLKSAAAAVLACMLLSKDLPLKEDHLHLAMETVFIPGRLQYHKGIITILYDVSHNAQSARLLAQTMKQSVKKGRVHAVFSALKDKDLFGLIFPLKDCVDRWYPAQLDNKRAASPDKLLSIFRDAEIFVEICYTSPLIAFNAALQQAKAGDMIVVYGSFFTVGQVMASQNNILNQEEIQ